MQHQEQATSNSALSSLLRVATAFILCMGCIATSKNAHAAGLIRVTDGQQTYEGKVVALTRSNCSLMDRQGQLIHLDVSSLKSLDKISAHFQPLETSAFRQQLREEFSNGYEVVGTARYLVCAPNGNAGKYAKLFESIYRDVEQFYRVRGFKVNAPEVPLVAVVFGSQREFAEYCVSDGITPSATLMGYYSLNTNRVALFDDPNLVFTSQRDLKPNRSSQNLNAIAASNQITGETASTIIHETTHQVGYNIGIHSRLGRTPIWVVEGLATVLEPSGMRTTKGRQLISERINNERAIWFEQRHRPSRKVGNLAMLVASDEYFHQNTLNSYSESWAFAFFLMENASRRQNFVNYLQQIGKRDPMAPYSGRERLEDFQAAFGDISRLEVEFIRYMDRM
ncbi:MAG: DUF1570 domain-containing protein [Fuerstiella sp.]